MYNTPTPKIVSKSVSQKIQGKWKSNETSWVAFIQWQKAIQMGSLCLHPSAQAAPGVITPNSEGWGRGWEQEGDQGALGRMVIWSQSEWKGEVKSQLFGVALPSDERLKGKERQGGRNSRTGIDLVKVWVQEREPGSGWAKKGNKVLGWGCGEKKQVTSWDGVWDVKSERRNRSK